jgi:preprotein translocase subunit SecA
MFESVNTPLIHHLQNALKARDLYRRDREYVVTDGEVQIVDENTGRVLDGRRYSEGLHQAIEAKEGVTVKAENQTLATVTLQNYYRTYEKLAGMTGTAKTEESEFLEIYGLGVVEVPTNQDVVRVDHADVIYKTEEAKFAAAVEEIAELHDRVSRCSSARRRSRSPSVLSAMLTKRGVKHEVLNAKNHAREADIVAQAGRLGAVTVSTNMAGRGTDIILGGNAEQHAQREVAKLGRMRTRRSARGSRSRRRSASPPSSPRRARRSASSAASSCSGPSVTSRGASTTSCAAAPDVRVTPEGAASTSRSRTT